jgi:hypothetical protein
LSAGRAGDKRDSPDARNTNGGAISTGWAARPNTVSAPNVFTFSAGIVDGMSGVHTGLLRKKIEDRLFLGASCV